MLHNRKGDMTPFDMWKSPVKQRPYLLPFIWGGSYLMTRQFGLKIEKKNMSGLKPPFLVLSTHQGFSDYYIAPLALFPHRANYVSDMEGYAAFGERLYRGLGCIGKRRYVSDFSVVKNIRQALRNKQVVVVFPESRHSNVGTTAYIPDNMGKLAKKMGVPLVILSVHGSYLANPFWDEEHTRKVPMQATLECIYTAKDIKTAKESDIQQTIEKHLQYDEYAWQRDNKIRITYSNRAKGLNKVLYQCRSCGAQHNMKSDGNQIICESCQAVWEMDEYGQLRAKVDIFEAETLPQQKGSVIHIPDWYEWERKCVEEDIENGVYRCDFPVRVEALPNAKGFVPLGEGRLTQNEQGFTLTLSEQTLFFDHHTRESVQTEYNYRGRGMCIVLSHADCCYYIYSDRKEFNPTKLQFAGEYYYRRMRKI